MTAHKGQCHCGNISFVFETKLSRDDLNLRHCSCDFCSKTGGVYTSDPNGHLKVKIQERSEPYRFGHKTADVHVCRRCGCVPVITCTIDGSRRGVVNARMIEGLALDARGAKLQYFDEETMEDRFARRARTWIPTISFA